MTESRTDPPALPAEVLQHRRRVYFEQFALAMVTSGADAARVGALVAELDSHLAETGADPVDELGPAGELASSMLASTGPRRLTSFVVLQGVAGASLFAVLVLAMSLADRTGDRQLIPVGSFLQVGLISAAGVLMWATSRRSVQGRTGWGRPPRWAIAAYFLVTLPAGLLASRLQVHAPVGVAALLLVAAVPTAVVTGWLCLRRWRVPVPGTPPHLRHLGWGPLGR